MCGYRRYWILILEGRNHRRWSSRLFRNQRFGESSADGRAVLAEGDDGGREVGGGLAATKDVSHSAVLFLTVNGDLAVEEEVTTVLIVTLDEVHDFDIGGVTLEGITENAGNEIDFIRRKGKRPSSINLGDEASVTEILSQWQHFLLP